MQLAYCKKCLTTNLRPNAKFFEGVCIACASNADHKLYQLDELRNWLRILRTRRGRKKKNSQYDCIVGVSGGKDSTRQAMWVRDRLKMKPLLICGAYPPLQMTKIGAENLANLTEQGFDIEIVCPAPRTAAKLSRVAFEKFGNVCKSSEMALFATVPKICAEKKIPLIFWGENPATQVGDANVLGVNPFDGNSLRNLNTLTEGGLDWLRAATDASKADFYDYPSISKLNSAGVDIVYLGPVWDDWGEIENSTYASLSGLTLRPFDTERTGDLSGASMLDEEYTNINMMIRYFKFGFGRATDYVNEEIRANRLTRDEGINIVRKYDGICSDEIIESYCNYIEIDVSYFWNIVQHYTNEELFECVPGAKPIPKFNIGYPYAE